MSGNYRSDRNIPPVLRGDRLRLRALSFADSQALRDLVVDEEVARYLHEGPLPDLPEIQNRIAGALRQWSARGYGMMAVEDADGFVGRLGVFHPADATDPLLVYALVRRAWGRGYATEGVGLLLAWLSERHSALQLIAHVDPANHASAHVVAKFGATRQGTIKRAGSVLDVWTVPLRLPGTDSP
jgi:RimJ/RimL family protein N-acetyltransferase